jgi:hypothetical protein
MLLALMLAKLRAVIFRNTFLNIGAFTRSSIYKVDLRFTIAIKPTNFYRLIYYIS